MKSIYFFIIAGVLSISAIVGLRLNFQTVAQMRDEILTLDIEGQPVDGKINTLREFSLNHMNADVEFELTGAYARAVEKAKMASEPTGAIYDAAQAACDRQGVSSVAQAQCVQDYLSARLSGNQNQDVELPNEREFFYSFVSPNWAPDLAGLSLLGVALATLIGLIVYIRNLSASRAMG